MAQIKKFFHRIMIFVLLAGFFSCEEQGWFVKCPDCTEDEPENAKLTIKLDLPGNNIVANTRIHIWEGNLEDSILYKQLIPSPGQSSTIVTVPVNKKYTITATYVRFNDTYIAVDSAFPRVRYDKEQCDNPCYFVYDTIVNLRLRNY